MFTVCVHVLIYCGGRGWKHSEHHTLQYLFNKRNRASAPLRQRDMQNMQDSYLNSILQPNIQTLVHIALWFMCTDQLLAKIWQILWHSALYSKFYLDSVCVFHISEIIGPYIFCSALLRVTKTMEKHRELVKCWNHGSNGFKYSKPSCLIFPSLISMSKNNNY